MITETPTGRHLELAPSSGGTETSGSVKRKAIGTIDFDRPGSYVVGVSGDFPERVFYIRPSMASRVLWNIAGMTLLGHHCLASCADHGDSHSGEEVHCPKGYDPKGYEPEGERFDGASRR